MSAGAPRENPRLVVCSTLIALPFLFPISAGPSVSAWQQLTSWLCIALLSVPLAGAKYPLPRPLLMTWFATVAISIALLHSHQLGVGFWLSAVIAIAATGMAACVGAGLACSGTRMHHAFAQGLLGAGLISAVLGLLQYYGLTGSFAPWTTAPDVGQAFGNLRQRNQFASLISMALIAALWLYPGGRRSAAYQRSAWAGAIVLLVVAAAASTSRTGLLQFLLIVSMAAFLAKRKGVEKNKAAIDLPPPFVLLSLAPLYFLSAWALPQLAGGGFDGMVQRLSEGAPAGHSRWILWGNVLSLIAERPWTGWGWGELSFAHYSYSALYSGPRFVEILDNAHNLPLHLAVELGIPAAVLICGNFLWLVIAAQPWREREPFRVMAWGLLGVIVLHSLLEYPLWYGPFQLVFGLCLGILWPAKASLSVPGRVARALPALLAAALGLIVAYAGWDYARTSQIYLPRDQRLPAYEDNTLAKLQGSWLFENQVRFAELSLMQVDRSNASEVYALARKLLHFSPEPRVIVKLIESAELLGRVDEARSEAERFGIAFPVEYAEWVSESPDSKARDSRQP
ncbi:O-antigen ligase C-terminal domain-containing protein [Variovorax sp. PAMC26660]|nr:O-antigen ligase C-terminal domain-containing protein [Variovorax sp. PAMC26660]